MTIISIREMINKIYTKMDRRTNIRESRKGFLVRCPSGSHYDHNPSCMIYHDGWVKCFSCGYSQPINKLAESLGIKERVVYEKPTPKPYEYHELKTFATDFVTNVNKMNPYIKGYLEARMITKEFIEFTGMFEWKNGYCRYSHNLTPYESFDRLAFPIYDDQNRLISFELRKYKNFEDNWPKVLYPTESPHKRFVFNQNNWDLMASVFITEGMLDLPNLFKLVGKTRVGCTFGSQLSDDQIHILEGIPNLVLCVDRDKAGLEMIAALAKVRENFKILIPHNSDLGADNIEMVMDDINKRIIPYSRFHQIDLDWFLNPDYDQMYDDVQFYYEEI